MTTTRPEIVIEGSADGQVWREYVFRYKPGPLSRPARWNIPHQPRLDWQMWFAALGSVRENSWIINLMWRLLQGSPSVLALLHSNPFPDGSPKYLRAQLYDYRFADRRTHLQTDQWWVRRRVGVYFPQVSLADFEPASARLESAMNGYGSAGLFSRGQGRETIGDERVDSIPADLDPNTQQEECRQTHHDAGPRRTQLPENSIGVAIAKIDTQSDEQDTDRVRQGCYEQRPKSRRRIGSERQGNGDRAGSDG
jgi:hypothetical protein